MKGISTNAVVEINNTASRYKSSIVMRIDNKSIDVKSILGLSLTLLYNQNYTLEVYGPDEAEAKQAMRDVLEKHGLTASID